MTLYSSCGCRDNHAVKVVKIIIHTTADFVRYERQSCMGSWIGRIYESSNFLFAGSKRHLMGEIFLSPSRPFYQSVITMGLSPIPIEKYKEFASAQFEKCGREKVVVTMVMVKMVKTVGDISLG